MARVKRVGNALSRGNQLSNGGGRKAEMVFVLAFLVFLGLVTFYITAMNNALNSKADTISENSLRNVKTVKKHVRSHEDDKKQPIIAKDRQTPTKPTTLVLTTTLGKIKISLRPDLSEESVEYIKEISEKNACRRCHFYRVEKPGIFQGIIASDNDIPLPSSKGRCPPGMEVKNECPPHDPHCGCHGPVMTRGMVGWAAGRTGPDFFIDTYKRPADWWGTQHTVFGEIQDEESFTLIDHIYSLPSSSGGDGMTYLKEKIHFEIELIGDI